MSTYIPESYQDFLLSKIAESTEQSVCSLAPTTYFQAIRPDGWSAVTTYVIGDLVHPPTSNGFIYECTVGGNSGAVAPGWGTSQDQTFTDGGVTWKTHINVALVNVDRIPADFSISDYSDNGVTGRKLTVAEKQGAIVHTDGSVSHVALIEHTTKSLRYVAPAQTTIGGNAVESGRTTIFYAMDIIITDPIEL